MRSCGIFCRTKMVSAPPWRSRSDFHHKVSSRWACSPLWVSSVTRYFARFETDRNRRCTCRWHKGAPRRHIRLIKDLLEYTTVFIGARTAAGDPALLEHSVRAALANVNDNVTVSFQTLAQEIDDSIVEERLTAILSGALGGLALLLAAVGVYGITAYAVGQRRREIAIRVALGATAWNVTSVMLRRGAWLGIAGTASGLVLAYASARAVQSLLYGVDVHHASSFGVAGLVLMATVVAASYAPSSRAARVDPMVALRLE